jgi:hypothetical protein
LFLFRWAMRAITKTVVGVFTEMTALSAFPLRFDPVFLTAERTLSGPGHLPSAMQRSTSTPFGSWTSTDAEKFVGDIATSFSDYLAYAVSPDSPFPILNRISGYEAANTLSFSPSYYTNKSNQKDSHSRYLVMCPGCVYINRRQECLGEYRGHLLCE